MVSGRPDGAWGYQTRDNRKMDPVAPLRCCQAQKFNMLMFSKRVDSVIVK